MKAEIESAIKRLAEAVKAEGTSRHGDTMQLTQAVLNLTHALATLDNIKSYPQ